MRLNQQLSGSTLSTAGINLETMTGEATQERLKFARDNLMTAERRDLLNNVLHIGGFYDAKKPKVPEALFKTFATLLALKTGKRRSRDGDKRQPCVLLSLNQRHFMLDILVQRQKDG